MPESLLSQALAPLCPAQLASSTEREWGMGIHYRGLSGGCICWTNFSSLTRLVASMRPYPTFHLTKCSGHT